MFFQKMFGRTIGVLAGTADALGSAHLRRLVDAQEHALAFRESSFFNKSGALMDAFQRQKIHIHDEVEARGGKSVRRPMITARAAFTFPEGSSTSDDSSDDSGSEGDDIVAEFRREDAQRESCLGAIIDNYTTAEVEGWLVGDWGVERVSGLPGLGVCSKLEIAAFLHSLSQLPVEPLGAT